MPDVPSPFASRSVGRHLLRGLVGFPAMIVGLALFYVGQGWLAVTGAIGFGALAVVAFRGCFLCWTLGLVETVIRRWRGEAAVCAACAAGARPPPG